MMIKVLVTRTHIYDGDAEQLPPFFLNPGLCDGYNTLGRVTLEKLQPTIDEMFGHKEYDIRFTFTYAGMLSP